MKKVIVVVPTLNNKDGGYEALHSIQGSYDVFWQPIIVDNWRHQRSVVESWNWGIEQAIELKPDYILVINDDVLFSPWTLSGLVRAFESPMLPNNTIMVTGQNLRDGMASPEDIFNIEIPNSTEHEFNLNPDFSCFMVTPKIFEKVGTFDENFRPAYFEDNDYHRRIDLLGYHAISTNWAPYYHYGSVTQNRDPNNPIVPSAQYVVNQEYYVKKWGGPPMFENYVNPYNDLSLTAARWKLLK